jgi:hypothetical protein
MSSLPSNCEQFIHTVTFGPAQTNGGSSQRLLTLFHLHLKPQVEYAVLSELPSNEQSFTHAWGFWAVSPLVL